MNETVIKTFPGTKYNKIWSDNSCCITLLTLQVSEGGISPQNKDYECGPYLSTNHDCILIKPRWSKRCCCRPLDNNQTAVSWWWRHGPTPTVFLWNNGGPPTRSAQFSTSLQADVFYSALFNGHSRKHVFSRVVLVAGLKLKSRESRFLRGEQAIQSEWGWTCQPPCQLLSLKHTAEILWNYIYYFRSLTEQL